MWVRVPDGLFRENHRHPPAALIGTEKCLNPKINKMRPAKTKTIENPCFSNASAAMRTY